MQRKPWLPLIFTAFCLTACSTTTINQPTGDTDSLENLQQLSAPPPSIDPPVDAISDTRMAALKDVAMTVGAQAGLHWKSEKTNALLQQKSKTLDQIYNFTPLLLGHSILPPVLTEGRQTLNLDGPDTIRLADKTYEIVSQAKFVTTSPTWRDYLWMDYPQPPKPDNGILPHTANEKKVWQELSIKGWNEGVEQADDIYAENLSRLERDYKGILLYRNLRAQNMVSAPFVATTQLGVTGGGSNLNVNDQVLRITALPALQPNSARWKPALSIEPQ